MIEEIKKFEEMYGSHVLDDKKYAHYGYFLEGMSITAKGGVLNDRLKEISAALFEIQNFIGYIKK